MAHVSIYESLIAASGFDKETETAVFDAMTRKSVPELDKLLGGCSPGSAGARLRELARVSGGLEALDSARTILGGASDALDAALEQLARVADMLGRDFPEVSLGFDFCELRGYNYHTGLVFAAYVPGHGDSVAKGGRYDAIGSDFGRARPATGFSLDIRALVALGERPYTRLGAIWAPAVDDSALEGVIAGLRMTETVIRALPGDPTTEPRERGCDRQLVKQDGQWVVEMLG